jgi:hypothetical protein
MVPIDLGFLPETILNHQFIEFVETMEKAMKEPLKLDERKVIFDKESKVITVFDSYGMSHCR